MQFDVDLERMISAFGPDAIRRVAEEAYKRGEASGWRMGIAFVNERLSKTVGDLAKLAPPGPSGNILEQSNLASTEEASGEEIAARRAPRGLTRQCIVMVLEEQPGLPLPEVQKRVVSLDSRVSAKTVYNEMHREQGLLYSADEKGRWSLVAQPDVSDFTLEDLLG